MSSRVFISYRREDSKWQARMIYEAFERVLGRECVFMDIDSIPPGADFRKILKDWVDSCDILLALIGPGWIDAMDRKAGKRRIDDANDFVRIEIAEALARGIPVVPVLLDGASLPDIHLLPDDLRALVDRQAEVVEYRTFDNDVARLIRRLGLGPLGIPSVSSPRGQLLRSDEEPISKKGRVKVHVGAASTERARWIKAGGGHDPNEAFQDLVSGPEMVLVPAGELTMGSPTSEEGRFGGEGPQRTVTIVRPFAVGRFPVTFDEWDAAVAAGGCKAYRPPDEGWGRGRHPVIHVSW
jgi:hypothetical protein